MKNEKGPTPKGSQMIDEFMKKQQERKESKKKEDDQRRVRENIKEESQKLAMDGKE